MSVKVASLNVARALDYDDRRAQVLDGIERIDADVIVLPEAFGQEDAEVIYTLRDIGYTALTCTEYKDTEPRDYLQHIVVGSRLPSVCLSTPRLATRQVVGFTVTDPDDGNKLRGLGVHFDDRSTPIRSRMAEALAMKLDKTEVDLAIGDFNDMHAQSIAAKLVRNRYFKAFARSLPEGCHTKLDRIKSIATRLSDMGDGVVMDVLLDAELVESDNKHHSTMLLPKFGIPFGQLDHALHTPELWATNFRRHRVTGTDHLGISANFRYLETIK